MTQPTNLYSAYQATGSPGTGVGLANREDLEDMIWMISPIETPLATALPKTKAAAVFHEWVTDALANTSTAGAIDGDDPTLSAPAKHSRFANRTQIFTKAIGVSGTQEVVNKAAKDSEIAYQVAKAMKEIKRNIEATITANAAANAGNDTTGRVLAGLPTWYQTNSSVGATGANVTTTSGAPASARTDGTQRALTETLVRTVLQSIFTAGGDPDLIVVGASNKQVFSTFTGAAAVSRWTEAEKQQLVTNIDVYQSDFGSLKIVADRFSRARDCHIVDVEFASLAILRPLDSWDLAKTGDSIRRQVLTELTLEVRNEGAHGIVADLN